ncbi:MAG: carboxypeptidase-like regulatory domain-containing protein, partial [Calditrichia bacterium]
MNSIATSAFFLFITIVLSGCFSDAPRDNPFDPQNSNGGLELSGTVFTFYAPHQSIGNAMVSLLPGNIVTLTNSNGRFRFNDLKSGSYTLISTADGFTTDSLTMYLTVSTSQDIFLNALPYFKQIQLTTHHIARWFPPQDNYSLQIQVTADDNDGTGDIESLWYSIESISYSDTLQQISPGSDTFRGTVSEFDLPVPTLHTIIGKPFLFSVKDI